MQPLSPFRAYDIRGSYPAEINEDLAYKVGRAFVQRFQLKNVVVGRDIRGSGLGLFEALSRGITDQGADVLDVGVVTTPTVSFYLVTHKAAAAISISGSHSPGHDNALKLIRYPIFQISDEDGLFDIKNMVATGEIPERTGAKGKVIVVREAIREYQKHMMKFLTDIHDLKVVVDYGNGVGALTAGEVFHTMHIQYTPMFEKPDMSFPNHEANPHDVKNFRDLQSTIQETGADVGIFFDGDADRSVMVDEKGNIIFPDVATALLAPEALKRHPGGNIYYDLRFSRSVREYIEKLNGNPIMMRVGNPFYKKRLYEEGGALAAEFSGHIMFPENYCIDDGLFAAIQVLTILSRSKKKLSELVAPFHKYPSTPEMSFIVANPDVTLHHVQSAFHDGHLVELDGVTVEYKDWWFNLRKSNTEAKVRLRVEAHSKELLEQKLKEITDIINTLK